MQALKNVDSNAVEADVDPSDYVRRRAESVSLALVAQPAASRAQIGQVRAQGDEEPPNEWDVLNDIAGQLGYYVFEAAGTLYFGKPSWLIDNAGKTWTVRYDDEMSIHRDSELHPTSFPVCRRTADNDDTPVTLDLNLPADEVEKIKPGDKIELKGIPTFDAAYLVVTVSADVNGALDGGVTAETPVDPEPRPPGNDAVTGEGAGYDLAAGALGFDFGDFSDYGKLEPYTSPPGPSAIVEGALGVKQGQGFSWPCAGRISGIFNEQRSTHLHKGIDIAAPQGRPVFAARSGFVSFAGSSGAYGNLVKIIHGGNYETRYAHLSMILKKKGDRVEAGQQIGLVGSTGRSTGPHLHWEVRRDGVALNPRNFTSTPSPEVLGSGTFSGPVPLDPPTPPPQKPDPNRPGGVVP